MLKRFEALIDELAVAPFELTPRRFGLVTACDGGLIEVSGKQDLVYGGSGKQARGTAAKKNAINLTAPN